MKNFFFVLGAADPEMAEIEECLKAAGLPFGYAYGYAMHQGKRVTPSNAYKTDAVNTLLFSSKEITYINVECGGAVIKPAPANYHIIDHHFLNDPGYGIAPEYYFLASSLGQVLALLAALEQLPTVPFCGGEIIDSLYNFRVGKQVNLIRKENEFFLALRGNTTTAVQLKPEWLLIAAADHCLGHAYRGRCPGVDPDALMRWRTASRAAFQRRTPAAVFDDIKKAQRVLFEAEEIDLGRDPLCPRCLGTGEVYTPGMGKPETLCTCGMFAVDIRGQHVPEFSEAPTRSNICFVADGLPDPTGRVKIVCRNGDPSQIRAFMLVWAPTHGLTDIYGDPERGFAGGYRVI